jgi:hypothetical protein
MGAGKKGGGWFSSLIHILQVYKYKLHSAWCQQQLKGRQFDSPTATVGITAMTMGTPAITDARGSGIVRNRNARKSRDASNIGYVRNCRDSSNIRNVSKSESNVANNNMDASKSCHVSNSSESSNSNDAATARRINSRDAEVAETQKQQIRRNSRYARTEGTSATWRQHQGCRKL